MVKKPEKESFLVIFPIFFFIIASSLFSQTIAGKIVSFEDLPLDIDNNGVYEALVVDVSIEVNESTIFTLEAGLYKGENLIIKSYNSGHLEAGVNKVKINFEGKRIKEAKLDGPYTLSIILYDKHRQQISKITAETSFYRYEDFE